MGRTYGKSIIWVCENYNKRYIKVYERKDMGPVLDINKKVKD